MCASWGLVYAGVGGDGGDVLEGGEGGSEGGGLAGTPPSVQGPPMVPAEGGPNF